VPLVDLYGDVVLDVDVKPNRGDALSILGLAREVAAATRGRALAGDIRRRVGSRYLGSSQSGGPVGPRPRACRSMDQRRQHGPSPDRIQMRLQAGMRPVSNVVDAANYVMLETRPTHTFEGPPCEADDSRSPTRPGERLRR
jgi:phenylalanyl-tRNA synthetase beta chain